MRGSSIFLTGIEKLFVIRITNSAELETTVYLVRGSTQTFRRYCSETARGTHYGCRKCYPRA